MPEIFGFDCYSPREIAERVETVGVTKANLPLVSMVALGVLAGGFIGLGAMFSTLVLSDAQLSFAIARVLAGVVFSLGLILVVIAGAELFTGNNLLVMAFVAGRLTVGKMVANFIIIYVANFIGAAGFAAIVALPFAEVFFRGVLCNILVCLAVWLAMAGRSVTDKILAIAFPITAFVAAGFEHSVANMYFLPLAMFLHADIGVMDVVHNLVPVTLGNLVGGAGMVGLVYHTIYRRNLSSAGKKLTDHVP